MSLRARIFIIISVVIFLVLAISIFLIVRNKNKKTENANPTTTTTTSTSNNTQSGSQVVVDGQLPTGLTARTPTSLEVEKNNVEQLAKIFVERYGSYSTDNEFQNIKESESLVTKSLWTKISAGMNVKSTSQGFLGVTTKVVSASITDWSASKATVQLRLMREENKDGTVSNRYQNATVEMVKQGNVWLANALAWN
ncbi:MAG: hypothetical protein HYT15_01560 [Candidatus Magasanikbacteria bacterium]|nr:hypothetical protein [Candidatus Magasanikbacteria bacterium]